MRDQSVGIFGVSVSNRLGRMRERLAHALWVLPTFAALIAFALPIALAAVDIRIPPGALHGLLLTGFPEGAQRLVETVSGTSITIVSLVFSLTVVALQVAAQQYSPRLPQQFLRDRGTQVVIALFVGVFTYSVSLLRIIRTRQGQVGVPNLAVTVAFVLALAMMAGIIYFIHHLVHSIRVEVIMQQLLDETLVSIRRNYGEWDGSDPEVEHPTIPDRARPVNANDSRVIQDFEASELVTVAAKHDIVVRFVRQLGDKVIEGTPLAWVWSVDEDAACPDIDEIRQPVLEVTQLGLERSLKSDAAFGITQLVDIALRASSPAINDPTTALQSIEHLSVIIVELASHRVGSQTFRDDKGYLRVMCPGRDFPAYLDLSISQLRRAAGDECDIVSALMRLLVDVARAVVADEQHEAIVDQRELLLTTANERFGEKSDIAMLEQLGEEVTRALDRVPPGVTA